MIRQLLGADCEAYYKVRLKGLELHPEAFATGAEEWSKATLEQVKAVLEKSFRDDFVLGAFQDGSLMGVIGFKRERKHSVRHKGTVWGFVVLPEFRRQGIGKLLLNSLIAKVLEHGEIEYIRALVTVSPLNAGHVFEACGFSQYGLEQRGIKEGSNFYDQSYLRLNLRT